jgi:hypothetical protein
MKRRVSGKFAESLRWVTGAALLLACSPRVPCEHRVVLLPRLQQGQVLRYQSQARLQRHAKTQSRVATMAPPGELRRKLSMGIEIKVGEVHAQGKRSNFVASATLEPQENAASAAGAQKLLQVDFTITGNGELTRADGLDNLDPEQRLIWQFWVAHFAYSWTLPTTGVKPGEKWKSEEVEKTPAPLAGLVWERMTTYVENSKCPLIPAETCGVFLTKSMLRQKSSAKDATPEDYRLHELHTVGTAKGSNESITYVSLKTGLLQRATEDVQQSMDVTIAKADGTNEVHYTIDVSSRFETVMATTEGTSPH